MDHLLNLFPVSNQNQLSLSYRLIEIDGLPTGKTVYQNLQRIRYSIGREYGTPAVTFRRDDRHYLAVAAETTKQPFPAELDVPVLQGLAARLHLLPDSSATLDLANLRKEDAFIATAFVGFALRGYLRRCSDLWQGASAYYWYAKDALALPSRTGRYPPVAVYPGFSYRVVPIPNVGLCVAVDAIHVYADTRTLDERIASGDDWRPLIGRHFLYEFGPQWYFIQLRQVSNQSIKEARFEYPPSSGHMTDVYDYTLDKWQGQETPALKHLCPDDRALVYNYPNRSGEFRGATTLTRLRYQTDEPEIGTLHNVTILDPARRLERIQDIIATHLDNRAKLGGASIRVSHQPLSISAGVFPVPAQQFGNDRVLSRPGKKEQALRAMWKTRMEWLRDSEIGPFDRSSISNQFILAPLSLAEDEALMDRVRDDIVASVDEISPVPYRPQSLIWDDQGVQTIPQFKRALARPQQLMERSGVACALVILPPGLTRGESGRLRLHIKKMLYPKVRTKCVQAETLLGCLEPDGDEYRVADRRYWSYLRNTALDLLVTGGLWLWTLADPLHYDLYVGVDVLNNTAGFTFVGAGGAICRFSPSTSEQKEKLSAEQMAHELLKNLRELIPRIQDKARAPRHLVIHRDGRFYDTEKEGMDYTVTQLCKEGLLPPDVQTGVVEIHKSHAERFRMFAELSNRRIGNPWVGSYHVFDDRWGMLCSTGHPAIRQGTAKPLVVRVVEGDLDVRKVLRDVYWLSVLAWTNPEGAQSTPVTIKLADGWLEPVAAEVSESEGLFEPLNGEESDTAEPSQPSVKLGQE